MENTYAVPDGSIEDAEERYFRVGLADALAGLPPVMTGYRTYAETGYGDGYSCGMEDSVGDCNAAWRGDGTHWPLNEARRLEWETKHGQPAE